MKQTIIFPTRTILHPRLDVSVITYVQDIPKSVYNRIKEKIHTKHPIFLTDYDYDYIMDEIERQDKIEFEKTVSGNSDE